MEHNSLFVRKLFKTTLFLLFASQFGFIVFSFPSQASSINTKDSQLTIYLPDSIHNLDPAIHRSRNIQIILKNILDSLTARDANMNVVPLLAESWKALNNISWEFKLKKGVKFHNNDDFTAEDVKFSLERIFREGSLKGKTSPRKSLLEPISEVNIIDRYTIRIKTKKPWPILPLMLSLQEIVPRRYMRQVGSDGFMAHPIGTSAFKFVKLEKDQRIILERFSSYFNSAAFIPPAQNVLLKHLIFQYVPTKSKQIQMLKKNECSIISQINPEALPILKFDPNIKILSISATRSYFAEFNTKKPPFDDYRVRQALNYAVDINKFISNILQGNGKILPTVLLPTSPEYNTSLKPYPYNPELSKKLLKDIGYDFNKEIQITYNKDELSFASNLSSFLTRIGIKTKTHLKKFRKPSRLGETAQWNIDIGSWGNSTLDPSGIIPPKFQSNGRGNYSGYSNKTIDELLKSAEKTSDLATRKIAYQKIQEIVYKDAPMIFGYAKQEFYGIRKAVKNFVPSGSGMMNIHKVYINKGTE